MSNIEEIEKRMTNQQNNIIEKDNESSPEEASNKYHSGASSNYLSSNRDIKPQVSSVYHTLNPII
jgi:hypothetical protein